MMSDGGSDLATRWSLAGKVALITGAASGIGAEHARTFVAAGARVVLTDVLDEVGGQLAAELGEPASYLPLDATCPDAWAEVTARVTREIGPITVLVNNAGLPGPWARAASMEVEDYLRVIELDQHGVFYGMRTVIPLMLGAGGGSIVNMSSVAGLVHQRLSPNPAYTAAKFAVRGLTKAVAVQYGARGIRANAILPGGTRTPMFDGIREDEIDALSATVPMGRIGVPHEIAQLALFLASDASSYVNGADYVVDGGLTAC